MMCTLRTTRGELGESSERVIIVALIVVRKVHCSCGSGDAMGILYPPSLSHLLTVLSHLEGLQIILRGKEMASCRGIAGALLSGLL